MLKRKVSLAILSSDESTVYLSYHLKNYWNVTEDEIISFTFGHCTTKCAIRFCDKDCPTLIFSVLTAEKIHLPPIDSLLTTYYSPITTTVTFGPIFALLTELKEGEFTLGSIESFCQDLALLSEQEGSFFYVSSLSLLQKNNPYGYVLRDRAWTKIMVPLPNSIHNRIHRRKTETSTIFQTFMNTLQEENIPFYNERFLHKWEVHEILSTFPYLTPYLPATALLTSKDVLYDYLERYQYIFLKPVHGSQGRRIIRIYKNDGTYKIDYTTFDSETTHSFSSFPLAFQCIRERINKQTYIVQKGLHLYTYHERPLDFRVLLHKNAQREWTISSIVARVAPSKEQFVSNIAQGGEIKKVAEVLQTSFQQKEIIHIKKLMNELAQEIAQCIDYSTHGLYGEFGIDLAIDTEGNPWIIEVNTKPSKNFNPVTNFTTIPPSSRAIFRYCIHLAEENIKE